MDYTASTVIGAFTDVSDAERAVKRLHGAGFAGDEVRLVTNERDDRYAPSTDRASLGYTPEHRGGIMNFFSRLFGMDDDQSAQTQTQASYNSTSSVNSNANLELDAQKYFREHYQEKRHLVVVHTGINRNEAISILRDCGGLVEDRAGQLFEQELNKNRQSQLDLSQREVVQLSEEELVARKEVVQSGEVTLRKDVVTEMRTIEVPVSHEEIVIEHRPIDRQEIRASESSMNAFDETTEIRIPVSEERLIIDKKVVPREEVRVSKQKVERTEHVTEEVRHEELEIERDGAVAMRNDDDLTSDRDRIRDKDRDRSALRPDAPRPQL